MEKYLDRIWDLRREMRMEADVAFHEHHAVSPRFYELQTELLKAIRNCRAWCKRHGVECPADI